MKTNGQSSGLTRLMTRLKNKERLTKGNYEEKKVGVFASLAVSTILLMEPKSSHGQINLNFTGITATPEHTIQLTWNSKSDETYEIDEADALATNADGSTAWNELYTGYPSQGTNTFWLDTGNYSANPPIVNPKYSPARFYRIVDLGLDTTSDEPTISITSLTNGSIVSDELTITVAAATDQPVLSGTKLFVDGQEMQMADTTSNYVDGSTNYEVDTYNINTCEWWNGSHTLFATAKCASGLGDALNGSTITTGNTVSSFRVCGRICGSKWRIPAAGRRVRYAWRPAATQAEARSSSPPLACLLPECLAASGGYQWSDAGGLNHGVTH